MKKIIALILVLLISCTASAEQDSFQFEGEWYIAEMYTRRIVSTAELKEDGCFYTDFESGSGLTFHQNGQVDYSYKKEHYNFSTGETLESIETETYYAKYCKLSEDAILYYDVIDNAFSGYYVRDLEDEWNVYEFRSAETMLFLNGHAIPYNGGDAFDYFISGNRMYLIQEDHYTRGTITQHGSSSFVLDIDSEPCIDDFGEIKVDHGTPFALFIRTSVVE